MDAKTPFTRSIAGFFERCWLKPSQDRSAQALSNNRGQKSPLASHGRQRFPPVSASGSFRLSCCSPRCHCHTSRGLGSSLCCPASRSSWHDQDGLRGDAMAQHEAWQVGGSAAELYQRYLVPAVASLWAADLIDRAAPRPGERVLDIACGTGVVSRLAAKRMGSGRVVGLDINAGMLAVARSLNSPSIEWYEGSALAMPFPDASFDLCLCQFGLQFFPDRPAAMREMFRVLQLGGRVALSVFSAIERTPVTNALAHALDRRLRPGASSIKRSEHSLADPNELRQLAVGQGFRDVSVNTVTQTLRFASPREYVCMQMTATPMAGLVADMESGPLDVLMDAIAGDLHAALCRDGEEGVVSPQEAHVLLARK